MIKFFILIEFTSRVTRIIPFAIADAKSTAHTKLRNVTLRYTFKLIEYKMNFYFNYFSHIYTRLF